jgi:hypothetical protein
MSQRPRSSENTYAMLQGEGLEVWSKLASCNWKIEGSCYRPQEAATKDTHRLRECGLRRATCSRRRLRRVSINLRVDWIGSGHDPTSSPAVGVAQWSLTRVREKLVKIGARSCAMPLRRLPAGRGRGAQGAV